MPRWTNESRAAQSARARAQKPWLCSTGPKTGAGKARSRYNASKHGCDSAAALRFRAALHRHTQWLRACVNAHIARSVSLSLCHSERSHAKAKAKAGAAEESHKLSKLFPNNTNQTCNKYLNTEIHKSKEYN
jgi:hypothetical protein